MLNVSFALVFTRCYKIHVTSIGSNQTVFNNYVVLNSRNNKTETRTTQRQNKIVLPQRISVKRQQKLKKKNTQKIEICDFEVAHDMKHNYSPPKLITYRLFSYFRKNQDRFRYLDFKVVFNKDAIAY